MIMGFNSRSDIGVLWLSEAENRNLAELKRDLEERIAKSEKDLALLRLSLKLVDEALVKGSFKPASKLIERPALEAEAPPVAETRSRIEPKVMESTRPSQEVRQAPTLAATPAPVTARAPAPTPAPAMAPAPIPAPTPMPVPSKEAQEEQAFPIKSKLGEDLGVFYVGPNYVRIVPRSDLDFSLKTAPFQSFFIDRVIGEMHRKDEMAVDAGAKDPSSMIAHDFKLDGDIIREILVRNIEEDARIRELRSSIRWTLERMLEKVPR
jgi:hypothetical protein